MDKIKRFYKKLTIMGKISLLIFIIFLIMGVFSEKIARFPHNKIVADSFVSPNKTHLLGTDDLGMDIFAQILYGARASISLSLFVAIVSTLIGASVGIVTAYYGGVIDRFLIRLIDVLTIIPSLPILIIISSFWGPSMKNIVIITSVQQMVFKSIDKTHYPIFSLFTLNLDMKIASNLWFNIIKHNHITKGVTDYE